MTIGIAAVCEDNGRYAVVMCCDFQGTRGDFFKAEDTDKMRDYDCATLLFADEVDAATEFAHRFEAVVREYNAMPKPIEDIDLRYGVYLTKMRQLVRVFIRERQSHAIATRFGIDLDEFYSVDAHKKLSASKYDEIFETAKNVKLGAEILVVYSGDHAPIIMKVTPDGYVSLEDGDFIAIGSGEPIATAAFAPDYDTVPKSLPECILRVWQAKRWAEANPFVGKFTAMRILRGGGQKFDLSEEAFDLLSTIQRVGYSPDADLRRWHELKSDYLQQAKSR